MNLDENQIFANHFQYNHQSSNLTSILASSAWLTRKSLRIGIKKISILLNVGLYSLMNNL